LEQIDRASEVSGLLVGKQLPVRNLHLQVEGASLDGRIRRGDGEGRRLDDWEGGHLLLEVLDGPLELVGSELGVVGDSHMRRHFQTSVLKGIGNKLV